MWREREREVPVDTLVQAGFTHAFVMEFANEEDRDYYAAEDQAHLEFKKSVRPMLERVENLDYTPGVY